MKRERDYSSQEDDQEDSKSEKKQLQGSSSSSQHSTQHPNKNLPREVIYQILVRLPADHLLPFKSVCKSWPTLFSHPIFIDGQLRFSPRSRSIMLTTFSKSSSLTSPSSLAHLTINLQDMKPKNFSFNFPLPGLHLSIKAACDGLLLLSNQHNHLFLYNPIHASSYKHLPDLDQGGGDEVSVWSLFYDPRTSGYRVCGFHYHSASRSCDILFHTIGENSWKQVSYDYYLKPLSPPIFLDHCLRWVTFDSRSLEFDPRHTTQCFVMAIEVSDTTFFRTYTPVWHGQECHRLSPFKEVQGSLCLTTFSPDHLNIFLLERDRPDIWTTLYSINMKFLSNVPASLQSFLSDEVCLVVTSDLDLMIFLHAGDSLICYDLKHQRSNVVGTLSKDRRLHRSHIFYTSTFVQVAD